MLFQAQREFDLDLTRTPFIGDDERDGQAAEAAGCPFLLGHGRLHARRVRQPNPCRGFDRPMTQSMRVLVTGHEGYIGSVMAPLFADAGHDVVGLDTGYFRDCTLLPAACRHPDDRQGHPRPHRRTTSAGFDAVVHLAALSNDPIGNLNEGWTAEINDRASRPPRRARQGRRRPAVPLLLVLHHVRDVGRGGGRRGVAARPADRVRAVEGSQRASDLASSRRTTSRRRSCATAPSTGSSPRMRFDTVFNNLMGAAVTTRPGRPCSATASRGGRSSTSRTSSRAFLAVLEAPVEDVHNQAFNTGAEQLNHQIIELAEIAVRTVPGRRPRGPGPAGRRPADLQDGLREVRPDVPGLPSSTGRRRRAQSRSYDAFTAIGLTATTFARPAVHPAQVAPPPARQRPTRRQPALGRAAAEAVAR